ncbi:MAG TPA: tRNA (adenosine(37)-N6)-threonylcarbamoyltransferase complex ATPase subunit type 1 TsaE [Haploplasma sp.]|nr:tRNA (adenosine(37)-N6)-threonylcarbamoyltransferase complex ATPase subunit type 1 TsaE [Haploplasma sp.]
MIIKTNDANETILLGEKLGKALINRHAVILLDGDLAAGKTTFTKGIAKGLGVNSIIKSPTFTIMRQYEGLNNNLYHLDLYRLDDMGMDFDLEEYVDDLNSVVVIEWPYQVEELLPSEFIKIHISRISDEERKFEISYLGNYGEVLEKL